MKTISRNFVCFALIIALCLPGILAAQMNPNARQHEGFFMRFLAGGGPGKVTIDDVMCSEMIFTSTGGDFHFQIGSSISDNLIVFGDLGGFSLMDPEVEWFGETATLENLSVSAIGYGAGLTYYMMPANFYFSGSVLYCSDTIEYENVKGESESGLGFFLALGKEWWVGNNWGLGVALFLESSSVKDKEEVNGVKATIKNLIYGIAFSATMD